MGSWQWISVGLEEGSGRALGEFWGRLLALAAIGLQSSEEMYVHRATPFCNLQTFLFSYILRHVFRVTTHVTLSITIANDPQQRSGHEKPSKVSFPTPTETLQHKLSLGKYLLLRMQLDNEILDLRTGSFSKTASVCLKNASWPRHPRHTKASSIIV